MKTLQQNLSEPSKALRSIIDTIVSGIIESSYEIKRVTGAGFSNKEGKNSYGDDVSGIDLKVNGILFNKLIKSQLCCLIGSEETSPKFYNGNSKYDVFFDPLDGSSNIDLNLPTGTIFSVVSDNKIIAAGYALYGTSTTLVLAIDGRVNMYTLSRTRPWHYIPARDEFTLTRENIKCPEWGPMYSINEAYSGLWIDNRTHRYIEYAKHNGHNSRNVGCMVVDCHRILMNGGIFVYPENSKSPRGKLRLLYEAMPMAYIFNAANGLAFNSNHDDLSKSLSADETGFTLSSHLTSVVIGSIKNVNEYFNDPI